MLPTYTGMGIADLTKSHELVSELVCDKNAPKTGVLFI